MKCAGVPWPAKWSQHSAANCATAPSRSSDLTFKPDTDDMREAPAIALITALHDLGARVRAYDPAGMEHAKAILPEVTYCDSAYACAENSDAIVIVTEWEQFRTLDLQRLKTIMRQPVMVDLRNIYRPEDMTRLGFVYESVGRKVLNIERRPASMLVTAK